MARKPLPQAAVRAGSPFSALAKPENPEFSAKSLWRPINMATFSYCLYSNDAVILPSGFGKVAATQSERESKGVTLGNSRTKRARYPVDKTSGNY